MMRSCSLSLLTFAVMALSSTAWADGALKCIGPETVVSLTTDIATGDGPGEASFKIGTAETRINGLELQHSDGQVIIGDKIVQMEPFDSWAMRKDVVSSAFVRPDLKVFTFELSDKSTTVRLVAIPKTVKTLPSAKEDDFAHYTFDADAFLYPSTLSGDVRLKCTLDTDL